MSIRSVILVLGTAVLLAVVPANAPAFAQAVTGTVRLRDYLTPPNDTNCTNDVTAKVRAAHDAWFAMQRAGNGGALDLGAGCYRITSTIHIGPPPGDGAGVMGHVYGAGPDLTRFQSPSGGVRAMQINDFWGGTIEDFSLRGPGKQYTGTTGLVLAARHQDLGTCCSMLRNITASDYGRAIQIGDYVAPYGAAAELVLESVSAASSDICFNLGQWNTLDVVFIRSGASFCRVGWQTNMTSGAAGQVAWLGGAATQNDTDFVLYGYNYTIDNFRTERRGKTGPSIVGGFGGNGNVSIRQYLMIDSVGVPTTMSFNGGMSLDISQSFLLGAIEVTGANMRIIATQNGFYVPGQSAFRVQSDTKLRRLDNWYANAAAGGTPSGWMPNSWVP